MKLAGRRALVTGGSQGLGLAIANAFVTEGAQVTICARDPEPLLRARAELEALRPDARVLARQADVSRPEDVESLVSAALSEMGGIDVLVCNAGVYGPMGATEELSWEDWRRAVEINLFGSVLPCLAVVPHFKRQNQGKLIFLSGGGATKPTPFLSSYAASKAAVVRFAETLAEELAIWKIDVNAVAPGALNTRLLDEMLDAGPALVGEKMHAQAVRQKQEGGHSLSRAAELCVFLASEASDGISGRLLSAIWDPWETLGSRVEELRKTDIYTLRRIVPEDRGGAWG